MRSERLRTDHPIEKVADGVYRISDFGVANCYLVVGSERALLIDCGIGIGGLKEAVEAVTDKPLYVVGTHGHVDHVGGDGQFERIFVHTKDTGRIYRFMTSYFVRAFFFIWCKGVITEGVKLKDLVRYKKRPEIVPIEDGYVFELGDRNVRVEHAPGHTYGSILLFDDKTGIVFTGDNMCPAPWLFLPNAAYVDEWLVTAKRIEELSKAHTLLWGHVDGKLPQELVSAVREIGEDCLEKYKKNAIFSRITIYREREKFDGGLVIRTGHVRSDKAKR